MKHKALALATPLFSLTAIILVLAFYIRFWPFELLLSFAPHASSFTLAGILASALMTLLRLPGMRADRRWLTAAIVGLAAGSYAFYYSLSVQPPLATASPAKPTLSFATFNKLYSNGNVKAAADHFLQQRVDVIALQETTPNEVTKLQQLMGYGHSASSDKIKTASGTVVGIVSKYPIKSVDNLKLANGPSLLRTVVATPDNGDIAFYATHLPGPFTPNLYAQRGASFSMLADKVARDDLPVVLGGDFNTTVFSPDLRQFNDATDDALRPVTTERWPACSWYGFGSSLCIRIDHAYIPKGANLIRTDIAPDLGSDHRAVIVTFSL